MPSINDYIDSINLSIDSIRANKTEILDNDIPSDFKLMMSLDDKNKDSRIMQFIFDTKLDKVIDNLLNRLMIGDYSEIERYSGMIKKVFEAVGIGEGAFNGPVSQALMANITNSLNSVNFNITQNKIKKCMILIRNLKYQARFMDDPALKKKYLEAVHALKQVLRFAAKVYKDRRIITNRVRKGLHYAVNESMELEEPLDLDFDLTKEED